MELQGRYGLDAPSVKVWHPPPWTVPPGRKPSYGRRLLEILPVLALSQVIPGSIIVGSPASGYLGPGPRGLYLSLGIVVAAYGIVMIATARGSHFKPLWVFPGLVATPSATIWYGLAFLLPDAAVWSGALVSRLVSPASPIVPIMCLALPLPIWAACILLARASSNRPIKRAIITGAAPSYQTAAEWWWNGEIWLSAAAEAPESALRSPDGNYWWTGAVWFPMPPQPGSVVDHTFFLRMVGRR